jgi:hypothetical protein
MVFREYCSKKPPIFTLVGAVENIIFPDPLLKLVLEHDLLKAVFLPVMSSPVVVYLHTVSANEADDAGSYHKFNLKVPDHLSLTSDVNKYLKEMTTLHIGTGSPSGSMLEVLVIYTIIPNELSLDVRYEYPGE